MVAETLVPTVFQALPSGVGLLAVAGITIKPLAAAVAVVAAAIAGGLLTWVVSRSLRSGTIRQARVEAEQMRQTAAAEAEAERQRIMLEAEKRATLRREEVDRELAETAAQVKKDQERLDRREEKLDQKLERINATETRLEKRAAELEQLREDAERLRGELAADRDQMRRRLSEVAGMSTEQARERFMDEVRHQFELEGHALAQRIIEEAEAGARGRAREITIQAIQRFAAEHVADSTIRTVRIPSDDLKGRIIGREGRNIRVLEKATGVDVLVDDTPGVIAVSCFDPIRRAIAGEALSRLVADGRVHPSRIEEIVATVRKEIEESIRTTGNDAVMEAQLRNVHPKLVEAMGKLHFRTSYGQNVLRHSIEVAYLSQIIADQLGLDGALARRCGFLHDIGKALDHEVEGGHPAIGMDYARRFGEKQEAVLNAIGGHHGDIEATTPYTPIVMAADAISGARPGARRESMENYVKRLEQLEGIALAHPEVTEAHAFQAGREVRVIVDADRATDAEAFAISRDIARRVEEEMTFPGEIKVTVIREVRAESVAR
jgi:ribonuclease Y